MKILIIDGQGGRIGKMLVEKIRQRWPELPLIALGTNSIATSTMLRAGAQEGATGENPVIYNAQSADVIIGPIGIVLANSLLGEITPAMAAAVAQSDAQKILIPMNRCKSAIAGVLEAPLAEYIELAANLLQKFLADKI
ncbi:DUF3842 family protein [Christensenellaceae bacterium 44-20]